MSVPTAMTTTVDLLYARLESDPLDTSVMVGLADALRDADDPAADAVTALALFKRHPRLVARGAGQLAQDLWHWLYIEDVREAVDGTSYGCALPFDWFSGLWRASAPDARELAWRWGWATTGPHRRDRAAAVRASGRAMVEDAATAFAALPAARREALLAGEWE